MTKAKSMALHEELNSMLRQGQRECLHLNGLIRKLKSGQAMLMMKKDKAKKELESYVNKMSESLIEFKSEMLMTIQSELDAKVKEMTSLRDEYEAYISAYMELCDETEKLVQFGKVLVSKADLLKAEELLKEFSHLQEFSSKKFEIDAMMKLEFYPALPVDCISSSVFGDLIRGASPKSTKSFLSALSARKSKSITEQSVPECDKNNSCSNDREKIDQCTQTDGNQEMDKKTPTGVKENQGKSTDSSGYGEYDSLQYVTSSHTSPPGFGYVGPPYYTYESYPTLNPPPGFPVGGSLYPYELDSNQVNSCLLSGIPFSYNEPQFSNSFPAFAAQTLTYPFQNIPLYTCNRQVSPEETYFYKPDQHFVPVLPKSSTLPITSLNFDTEKINTLKNNPKKTKTDEVIKKNGTDPLSEVKKIPLPVGPAPRDSVLNCKTEQLKDENIASVPSHGEPLVNTKHRKDDATLTKLKDETVEGNNTKIELDTEKDMHINKESFERFLTKTKKLVESSFIGEMRESKRSDESVETEHEMLVNEQNKTIITAESSARTPGSDEKSPLNKMEIDQMLSNIGHDLKAKINKGEEIISPIKPLRRPLRLPRNLFPESKAKAETENILEELKVNEKSTNRRMDSNIKEHQNVSNAGYFKSENDLVHMADTKVLKSESDDVIKKELDEHIDHPNILDLSSSTGVLLTDVIKGQDLSKREITEKNKETLQLQTNWLKGYLKQVLPERKEKDVNTEVFDENNNVPVDNSNTKIKRKGRKDEEKVFKTKADGIGSRGVPDIVSSLNVVECSCVNSAEQDVGRTEKDVVSIGVFEEIQGNLDQSKILDWSPKDNVDVHTASGVEKSANEGKVSDVPERKPDLKHLKSAVKGFLGEHKENKQRTSSTYSRLGALQAHWLNRSSRTNVQAKFLFECSHKMHFPIGVTTNSMKQILVADTGNHCVKMFDQDGEFIREFKREGMRRPSAIVVNEFDHIFVKDDLSISMFDTNGAFITEVAKGLNKPFGLVLTPARCLLVLETDWHGPALVHISQDGMNMWSFPYTPLVNAPPGSKCRFMGVSENNVVVSDLGLSKIYITNFEGIFFKVIGSFGTGIMQFFEPSGISVDNYGNIAIGDSKNNRVQVYRHDGSYTGLIQFDEKITRPSGIHLTSDNKLIVVNFLQHVVKVYQLMA